MARSSAYVAYTPGLGDEAMNARVDAPTDVLEMRVAQLRQIFNSMDPAPFRERELDPGAVDYIVGWASRARSNAPLSLRVHVDAPLQHAEKSAVGAAIRDYFGRREANARRELRRLLRVGFVSLLIGLCFLSAAVATGEVVANLVAPKYADVVRESFIIGGWVALWRPLEIFLYLWWPIVGEIRRYRQLRTMNVFVNAAVDETVPRP